MPPISLLIKPASSLCNIRCAYCFYHSIAENREIESYGVMKLETLELLVQKALSTADQVCGFAFQGGEPTVAGLPFFQKLIEFQKKYNVKKVTISNSIQTNGILIDEKWAAYLAENNFLVGLSLDGPGEIHDLSRVDVRGRGTFSRVMETVALFNRYRVEYNILFVVSAVTARHPEKIYRFFKKNGFKFLQFIPCLDPLHEKPGSNPFSLRSDRYADFLIRLFDLWIDDFKKGEYVSIRWFDNLVGMLMGRPPEQCGMLGQCRCQFVVEADGSVFPCDFYVIDAWRLGNIHEMDLMDMLETETAKKFMQYSLPVDPKCRECNHYSLCRGGCRRSREPFSEGIPALNHHCTAYMKFFDHAVPRMQEAARMLARPR
ncbi:MAG TPA: anaerobic sulfatase maturase [Clostridiales bacterium]|nr:anaerobic sulfatase maturase [Clostridiales bacterium]